MSGGDLLSHGQSTLSSALSRFTALFEMGRGGSKTLWPPNEAAIGCGVVGVEAPARDTGCGGEVKDGVDVTRTAEAVVSPSPDALAGA